MLLVLLVLLICSAYLQLELRLNKNIFFMYIYMSQLFPPPSYSSCEREPSKSYSSSALTHSRVNNKRLN